MGLRTSLKIFSPNKEDVSSAIKIASSDKPIKLLGKGISGRVDLCRNKHNQRYVVKTFYAKESYETKKEYKTRVLKEYDFLSQIRHLNVIQAYEYKVSLTGEVVKLYLEHGEIDMYQLVRRNKLERDEIDCFWKQMCCGVEYLHSKHICHRDLKSENIVVTALGVVKIIDFGVACQLRSDDTSAIGIVGSESYMAPETVSSIRYEGMPTDVWSLGIVYYYMNNRRLPWRSAVVSDERYSEFILEHGDSGADSDAVWSQFPPESVALMRGILDPDPATRTAVASFATNRWFGVIDHCDSMHRCGIVHSDRMDSISSVN